jgi:hypothetical protein
MLMLTHPLAYQRERERAKVSFFNKGMGRMKQQPDALRRRKKRCGIYLSRFEMRADTSVPIGNICLGKVCPTDAEGHKTQ